MTILASMPIVSHPDIANAAIESLREVALYLVCNNKEIVGDLSYPPAEINEVNNYCNGSWNQAMAHFLEHPEFDWLVLTSQDVIMRKGWSRLIPDRSLEVYVPVWAPTLELLPNWDAERNAQPLVGNPAGACMILPRAAIELVYPIPSDLKLWFGDEYIFTTLRQTGWTIHAAPLAAYHYGSLSIAASRHAYDVIEADKIAWKVLGAI